MSVLEISNCDAGYGAAQILFDVHLRVEPREIVTIIGPNGAGKSTLIKVAMGYLSPGKGRILLNDRDVTRLRPDQRVAAGIAYVPQLENVFPNLTVVENLRMGGYRLDRGELRGRIERQLEQFPRLAERRHQRASTMSGGERQMLAMGRALMTEPDLLLLDEPSAALSPGLVEQVFDTIRTINREQGRAILIVEQDAHIALNASNRGYVLADGGNVLDDQADRILANQRIREAYLGAEASEANPA